MRALLIPTTLVAAILLGACGSGEEQRPTAAADKAASGPRVEIKAFQFKPDPIEVKAGDTVTFVNLDGTTHDVTSEQLGVAKTLEGKDSEATVKFDKPGTYKYVCTLHSGPGMRGQVIVR